MASKELNAHALRQLADWFDTYDDLAKNFFDLIAVLQESQGKVLNLPSVILNLDTEPARAVTEGKEVQTDLRRWADELDTNKITLSPTQ